MSSSAPAPQSDSSSSYYVVSDERTMDNQEVDLSSQAWQFPTTIEDDDITFDGKPLSALYEEERRRLSATSNSADEEEEKRGRQRVRQEYTNSSKSSKSLSKKN